MGSGGADGHSEGRSGDRGRYEAVAELGRGGMAALQLARVRGPSGFTKYAALKRILDKWADDEEFVGMFLDEARLAATLDHPNVVHVYDAGRDEDGPFFAMEYIHGENLSQLRRVLKQRDERLPLAHALSIAAGIAAGLHHAHERRDYDGRPLGIIHRDVSPSNVLVTYEGSVKVVDFGIAKATISQHATRPSVRKGKISYMSPEQCRGDPLDRRSDVFALGAVLHELVCGQRLFVGDNEFVVMNRIVNHDAPPPSEFRPGLPEGLDPIVARALARDPEERYESARALQRELEALAQSAGLVLSSAALGDYLCETLGTKPYPWAKVEAQSEAEAVAVKGRTEPARRSHASGDEEATGVVDRPLAVVAIDGEATAQVRGAVDGHADETPTTVGGRPSRSFEEPQSRRGAWGWVAVPMLLGAGALVWTLGGLGSSAEPAPTAEPEPSRSAAEPAAEPEPRSEREPEPAGESVQAGDAPSDASSTGGADISSSSSSSTSTEAEVEAAEDLTPIAEPASPKRRRRRTKPASTPSTTPAETSTPKVPFDPDGPAPRRDSP